MDFEMNPSSPVLEIQSSDYALSRLRENKSTKENGSSVTHVREGRDEVIDLTKDSPRPPNPRTAGLIKIGPAYSNGHALSPTSSNSCISSSPEKLPSTKREVSSLRIAAQRDEPGSCAKNKKESLESPRPLKRQKIEPKTPETPVILKQERDGTPLSAGTDAAGRSESESSERVKTEALEREVPRHEYTGVIEGDTDEEDNGETAGARKLETKSALCQFKTRRKQGLAYKIFKHEVYPRLNLLVIESRYWTEYIGVFNSAEQATSIGEALVRQISSRVSNDASATSKHSAPRTKHSKDPRQHAHDKAKARLRVAKLPLEVNNYFKLIATGTLVTSGPGVKNYHNSNYVFPVGFKSIRNYFCCQDPSQKVNYVNEILRGTTGPVFRVSREGSEHSFEGASASAAWNKVCKRIAERKKELGMAVSQPALSGPGMFGLNVEKVVNLLEGLPNILKLEDYVFQAQNQTRSSRSKSVAPSRPRRKRKGEIDKGDEIINKLVQFRIEKKQPDVQLI